MSEETELPTGYRIAVMMNGPVEDDDPEADDLETLLVLQKWSPRRRWSRRAPGWKTVYIARAGETSADLTARARRS